MTCSECLDVLRNVGTVQDISIIVSFPPHIPHSTPLKLHCNVPEALKKILRLLGQLQRLKPAKANHADRVHRMSLVAFECCGWTWWTSSRKKGGQCCSKHGYVGGFCTSRLGANPVGCGLHCTETPASERLFQTRPETPASGDPCEVV